MHSLVRNYNSAEILKQKSLEIISIFYLLASDHDLDLLMAEMQKYDLLVEQANEALKHLRNVNKLEENIKKQITLNEEISETESLFNRLNEQGRKMMLAAMSGDKKEGLISFKKIQQDIQLLKSNVDSLEIIFADKMETESKKAESILKYTSWFGLFITILGVFITLGLIYYLMRFLSVTLLPISNLMHNLRQAVFSIDKTTKVIAPVSKYSSTVFEENILDKEFLAIFFEDPNAKDEVIAKIQFVMSAVFGEGEAQWVLAESYLPREITITRHSQKKIIRLNYTPLFDKFEKVQNIMVVAEDITEIAQLVESSRKRESELSVIKAFLDMDSWEIYPLLDDFKEKIENSIKLMNALEASTYARIELPRTLHTIKGNARMYFFTALAEEVHRVEAKVIEFNQIIADESHSDKEDREKLTAMIVHLRNIVNNYYTIANKLLSTTSHAASENNQSVFSLCRKMAPLALRLAKSAEKEIEFRVTGDEVWMGKEKVQILRDAIVHLIRNSIDHGIEKSDERIRLGKSPKGFVDIECLDRGEKFHVIVRDDGYGIDIDKVLTKAIEMGNIPAENAATLSEAEKLDLIFLPNLSTKKDVTIMSGRGVGMDAVKFFVESIGGLIHIDTRLEVGTEFVLSIPK